MRGEKKEENNSENDIGNEELSSVFINPVCGIPVEKNMAKHIINYEGEDYNFFVMGAR